MDNVTHSLAGVLLADIALAVHQCQRRRDAGDGEFRNHAGFRDAVFATALLSSNLPDLDILYVIASPGKLGYLLHHRGHTHTLLAVPVLACAGAALGVAWAALAVRLRGRNAQQAPAHCRLPAFELWLIGVFGGLLHIGMDFLNNYGVHPFWPFDNRWYYGDTIYIVDPWLIVGWCAVAWTAVETRFSKGLLLAIMAGVVILAWRAREVPPVVPWLLAAAALGAVWLSRHAQRRQRLWTAVLFTATLFGCLLSARHRARATMRAALSSDPKAQTVDIVSTPAPGNPLCWWVIAVQRDHQEYLLRQALVAPFGALASVRHCSNLAHATSAPLVPVPPKLAQPAKDNSAFVWLQQFQAPVSELAGLAQRQCRIAAFLRYARAPFWTTSGQRTRVGDLRYDRSPSAGFAELTSTPSSECPDRVPPWRAPRQELFGP